MADYYTSQQLALTVGIAESTIIELQKEGLLQPTVKDGRSFFSSRQAHCLYVPPFGGHAKTKIDLQAGFRMRRRTLACPHDRAEGTSVMATGNEHKFLSPSRRVWRVVHLRSVKDGSKGSLGEISARWAVARLSVVASRRTSSAWPRIAHGSCGGSSRVALARRSGPHTVVLDGTLGSHAIGTSASRSISPRQSSFGFIEHRNWLVNRLAYPRGPDGFAMADGFVLIGVGSNKQLVQWTAEAAWRGIVSRAAREPQTFKRMQSGALPHRGVVDGGSSACIECLARNRSADGSSDRVVHFSGAAGHALAQPFENTLGRLVGGPGLARRGRPNILLWKLSLSSFQNGSGGREARGFIVRRIPEEETPKD